MKLNYKASTIAKAEQESGINFFSALESTSGSPSMSTIMFLCHAGGATDEEIDEAMAKDASSVIEEIMGAIAESGFLGSNIKKKDIVSLMEKARKEKEAQVEKALTENLTEVSEDSGKTSK